MYFAKNLKIGEKEKKSIRVHQARMQERASQVEGSAYTGLAGIRHEGSFGEP